MTDLYFGDDFSIDQRRWLADKFEHLTSEIETIKPSECVEKYRYLSASASAMPGYYRFDLTPYWREVLDSLGIDSPIREVSVMKSAQIGWTVTLENFIFYSIKHVRSAPMMLVTADAELATARLTGFIVPMINDSRMSHLIVSADEGNTRKTGKTDKKLEWQGGGSLLPFGAQNADKLRSFPIRFMLGDETDAWPLTVGKNNEDPWASAYARTNSYEGNRKIMDGSTPLILGQSRIHARFLEGDQRRYFVCCLSCGFSQVLRWQHFNQETGEKTGITWQMDEEGNLIEQSVRYLCCNCGHPHTNDDKTRLLSPDHGAEWRPTNPSPKDPKHRSYHINALYSPPGMQSWASCVRMWLAGWDVKANHPRDIAKLQAFYNLVLGEPFKAYGEQLRFEAVSKHRRHCYKLGEIPNRWCEQHCDGPVLLLTCAVDVHADNLAVGVIGWCRDSRAVLIEYVKLNGDTEQLDAPQSPWIELRKIIEEKTYVADDGKTYRVSLTLIDSGYRTDHVYRFCSDYLAGVYPCKGRDESRKLVTSREFTEFESPNGQKAFAITVDFYKDRWAASLRREWSGDGTQPIIYFNAPIDITDKQLKELTVEVKREKLNKLSGERLGFEWHRPSGAPNELWDLLIYNNAALDLIAWNFCKVSGMKATDWRAFWDSYT